VRALFHSYSAGNCMLIALQCHERGIVPERVAGFRTWLKQVFTSDAVIDDACSTAWMILLRAQPRRDTVLAWLTVVARREAIRLHHSAQREPALEETTIEHHLQGRDDELGHDARRALDHLAELPPRQREVLALLVAGYSYDEIAELTGTSWAAVNRHLVRARRALRDVGDPADPEDSEARLASRGRNPT